MSAIKVDIILIGNQGIFNHKTPHSIGSGKTSLIKRFVGDKKQSKPLFTPSFIHRQK